jgi:molybdopterin converting factor small subunit
MALAVRIPPSVLQLPAADLELDPAPADIAALIAELERRHPGLRHALDSSSVNAALNGEVILSGRDATRLKDGDRVEFLVMFAGG